jgi:hypothetical protein
MWATIAASVISRFYGVDLVDAVSVLHPTNCVNAVANGTLAMLLLFPGAERSKKEPHRMRKASQLTRFLAMGLLLSGLSVGVFAQDDQDSKNQRDRMSSTSTMTGCLSKDASGAYTLTDETTGVKTTVTGPSDLEKHSANHKVTLTGAAKTGADGTTVFQATKLKHVSDTCKAPSQP